MWVFEKHNLFFNRIDLKENELICLFLGTNSILKRKAPVSEYALQRHLSLCIKAAPVIALASWKWDVLLNASKKLSFKKAGNALVWLMGYVL